MLAGWRRRSLALLLLLLASSWSAAFLAPHHGLVRRVSTRRSLAMRDASMVTTFEVNDMVKVKPGIVLDGRDWGGMVGRVASTWQKCDTDPACCCAELATEGAIRVDFSEDKSYQYFSESELETVRGQW